MLGGGNRIYGRHVIIHNGLFAECEVLILFEDFVVQGQGQGLVNWSSRTRTFLEDNNTDNLTSNIGVYPFIASDKIFWSDRVTIPSCIGLHRLDDVKNCYFLGHILIKCA